jgi:Raf kinase inhibitor-like YbhB/YbcL family protein
MHRIAPATAGLAILAVLSGFGFAGGGYARGDQGNLTFSSTAFPDGGQIPQLYACPEEGGSDQPPPLDWSAPLDAGGLALVMEDLNAVPGPTFVHWVVYNMHPGPGSSAFGNAQPGYGMLGSNGSGVRGYRGPCPPEGTGEHHYRFTLYQVPSNHEWPGGIADAATIEQAATASFTFTGTYDAPPLPQ